MGRFSRNVKVVLGDDDFRFRMPTAADRRRFALAQASILDGDEGEAKRDRLERRMEFLDTTTKFLVEHFVSSTMADEDGKQMEAADVRLLRDDQLLELSAGFMQHFTIPEKDVPKSSATVE